MSCAMGGRNRLAEGWGARTSMGLAEGASNRLHFLLASLHNTSLTICFGTRGSSVEVDVPYSRDTLPAIQEPAPVPALLD